MQNHSGGDSVGRVSYSLHPPPRPPIVSEDLLADGSQEVGVVVGEGGGDYTQRYTVTTRTTPASRWAATRAILMLHFVLHCMALTHIF